MLLAVVAAESSTTERPHNVRWERGGRLDGLIYFLHVRLSQIVRATGLGRMQGRRPRYPTPSIHIWAHSSYMIVAYTVFQFK
jgi:hypothetical protein